MKPFLSQMFGILPPSARWSIALLFAIFIPAAVLEALAVFSVLPLIKVLTSPELIVGHPAVSQLEQWLGPLEPRTVGMFLGGATLLLLISANAIGAFSVWMVQRFCRDQHDQLCFRLLRYYLFMPFHLLRQRNSNEMAKTILSETQQFVYSVLLPFLDIASRLVTTVVVVLLLLWINPLLTLLTGLVLGAIYTLLYLALRGFLFETGKNMVEANSSRFRIVGEALGGMKWIKLRGLESACLDLFAGPARVFARHQFHHELCSRTARYVVETVALGGAVLMVILLVWQRMSTPEIVAMTGLFAFASYRLLPSLQQVFVGLTRIRSHQAVLESLHQVLNRAHPVNDSCPVADIRFEREIRLKNVSYSHDDEGTTLFSGLDLTIHKGETLGIAGPTGCGKTTLVDMLLGLLPPTSGSLEVDGKEISGGQAVAWQRRLGYVPQHIHLIDDTIRQNIAWGDVPESEVMEAAKRAGIASFIESLPEGYETRVGDRGTRLSGGQLQRIGVARALCHRPEVLVLDEATSSLDGQTEEHVMRSVMDLANGMTLIVVAHRLETLRRCSRILLLDHGRIVATGTYEELEASSPLFRRIAHNEDASVGLP